MSQTVESKEKLTHDIFRLKRAEMNLSLKEVENATSIRIAYLQGIEEGRIGSLISPVYARGFVKQYAAFLGLDGERLVRANPELFGAREQQDFAYGIGTLEVRGSPGGGVKWLPNLLWAGGIAIVLAGAYYFAKSMGLL
ncbi:MAG: helix-turn-helix domain-containing protein [Parachlamydiales bacterium]